MSRAVHELAQLRGRERNVAARLVRHAERGENLRLAHAVTAHDARERVETVVPVARDERAVTSERDRLATLRFDAFEPAGGDAHRGHAFERVGAKLPSVLAPLDAARERDEVPPVGEQVDAVAQLAALHALDVRGEVVLTAACGELHRAVRLRASLVRPRAPRVIATVARVDVEDHEARDRAASDAHVSIVVALEPSANRCLVRRRVVHAVLRGRELPVRHDGEDGPAPARVGDGCFERGHGCTFAACHRARAWCCSA